MLAFNDVGDPEDEGPDPRAKLDQTALGSIQRAHERHDVVMVMVHWGEERSAEPTKRQRAWAERMIAAGADLIAGAHPHVVQPIEVLEANGRTGVVAHSLGNFIFDVGNNGSDRRSLVLRALVGRGGVARVCVAPVLLEHDTPRVLGPAEHDFGAVLADVLRRDHRRIAWRFAKDAGSPVLAPVSLEAKDPARHIAVDLRGNGSPLDAALDRGVVTVRDGTRVVWSNEDRSWRVLRIEEGDPDLDGRIELFLLLTRPREDGTLGTNPFLVGWREGRYRVTWGGSATRSLIQDAALGDLDGDGRDELVVLEGGRTIGAPGERVAVMRWHGWGFERVWSSPHGRFRNLRLGAPSSDGGRLIIVEGRDEGRDRP
jgi:poly-gamma-glutamate synthesis protein (capsule biosynthesis protein)